MLAEFESLADRAAWVVAIGARKDRLTTASLARQNISAWRRRTVRAYAPATLAQDIGQATPLDAPSSVSRVPYRNAADEFSLPCRCAGLGDGSVALKPTTERKERRFAHISK